MFKVYKQSLSGIFSKYSTGIFQSYKQSFSGLSREVWLIALMTLINRTGTMVLPFLSLYTVTSLGFSLTQVGSLMMFFGLGSFIGSWIGGRLTDRIGFYNIIFCSLLLTGVAFFFLQYIKTFEAMCAGIFLTMCIADTFRPAMFVALKSYSKPENKTRSLTLIRLAINLGFTLGPALGGLIIASIGFPGLFWIDAFTCVAAAILFVMTLKNRANFKPKKEDIIKDKLNKRTVFNDKIYWIFLICVFIIGVLFLQLFSVFPIYWADVFELNELQIGLFLSFNGFLVFLLEMPLVTNAEKTKYSEMQILFFSLILFAMAYFVLLLPDYLIFSVAFIVLLSFGEMYGFPFTNSFAMDRAPKGREGRYLAIYSMAFSMAHIIGPKTGMYLIDNYGYKYNWFAMGTLGLIGVTLTLWLLKELKKEKQLKEKTNA